jgi:outer membrane protein assembly factor BamB
MRYLLLLVLPLLLVACDSATDVGCDNDADCPLTTSAVLVANQGNFSDGDGSVTGYDPETETATERIGGLASIIQSLALSGDRLFVAANTGGRVEVRSARSGERLGQVEVESPRYVASAGLNKAYVTSLRYDRPSEVVVFDPATQEVTDTVEVGGFAEGLAVSHGRAYVATGAFGASTEVVVLDIETDEIVERIDVGCVAPRFVLADGDGEIWVFCAGSPEADGEILILDAASGDEVARLAVGGRIETAGPGQDAFVSVPTREVYVVRDGASVLRFDASMNALLAELDLGGAPIGAVAYDARTERLYVGRADPDNPYTAAGTVTIHDRAGAEVGRFNAGVLPSHIVFLAE